MDTPEGSERYERVRYDSSSTHLLHQQHPLQSVHVSQLHFTSSILLLHSIHHSLFHLHHPSSLSSLLSLFQQISMEDKSIISILSLSDTSTSRSLPLSPPLSYSIPMMVGLSEHSTISPLLFNSPSLLTPSLEETPPSHYHSLFSPVLSFKVSSLSDSILTPITPSLSISFNLSKPTPLSLNLLNPSLLSLDITSSISVSIRPSIHSNSIITLKVILMVLMVLMTLMTLTPLSSTSPSL